MAPFFKDFLHRVDPGERIELEWLEEEDPDTPRGALQRIRGECQHFDAWLTRIESLPSLA